MRWAFSNPVVLFLRNLPMYSRFWTRRRRNPPGPVSCPQLIRLEERLPLGDALLAPLLASSWLGAGAGVIWEGEPPHVSKEDSIPGLGWQTDTWDALWAAQGGDVSAEGEVVVASAARPTWPVLSGLQDPGDVRTAPPENTVRWAARLPERTVALAEAPGVAPGMEPHGGNPFHPF